MPALSCRRRAGSPGRATGALSGQPARGAARRARRPAARGPGSPRLRRYPGGAWAASSRGLALAAGLGGLLRALGLARSPWPWRGGLLRGGGLLLHGLLRRLRGRRRRGGRSGNVRVVVAGALEAGRRAVHDAVSGAGQFLLGDGLLEPGPVGAGGAGGVEGPLGAGAVAGAPLQRGEVQRGAAALVARACRRGRRGCAPAPGRPPRAGPFPRGRAWRGRRRRAGGRATAWSAAR